ncbi:MAG: hypothetical protein GY737_08105 [Desulfobacteraceae bacterium]|nr:hypothetical protein [Desulfobacteraceae bacterium]
MNRQLIIYVDNYEWNSNFVLSFVEIPIMYVPCIPRIAGAPMRAAHRAICMRGIRKAGSGKTFSRHEYGAYGVLEEQKCGNLHYHGLLYDIFTD